MFMNFVLSIAHAQQFSKSWATSREWVGQCQILADNTYYPKNEGKKELQHHWIIALSS